MTTPPAVEAQRADSCHLSLVNGEIQRRGGKQQQANLGSSPLTHQRRSPQQYGPHQSHATSDTSMTGLSDFPFPPGGGSLSSRPSLQTSSAANDKHMAEIRNEPDTPTSLERTSRRMTFGQEEADAEHLLGTFIRDV